MSQRRTISFESAGLVLRGWFYQAHKTHKSSVTVNPCIIMTHGFSGLKEHDLNRFAETFSQAGYHVLVYDNRNFGESDGLPRLEVYPDGQIADLQAAITFAETLAEVNPQKIGLWGTSFSAGVHIVTAALDKRAKCVVAQVPFVCGFHQFISAEKLANLREQYAADQVNREQGGIPQLLTVASSFEGEKAMLKNPIAYAYFSKVKTWENRVTFRSLQYSGDFRPIDYIQAVSPTPLLFIVASDDTINPPALAKNAFDLAGEPKAWVEIKGEHFAPYEQAFWACSQAAIEWYDKYLK